MATDLTPLPSNMLSTPMGTAVGPAGTTPGGGPRVNPIVRYLSALRRFKWLVLLMALAGLGGGYLMSRLKPESYVVHADLAIAPPPSGEGAIVAAPIYSSGQWTELLQKYTVLDSVAIDRRLYIYGPKKVGAPSPPPGPSGTDAGIFNGFLPNPNAEFVAGSYELKVSKDGRSWELTNTKTGARDVGAQGDSVGRKFGFLWLPQVQRRWYGESFSFDVVTPREAADQLKSDLKIDMALGGAARFMNLTLDGQDGDATAATLNDVMHRFVNQALALKRQNLVQMTAILDTQLTREQAKMRDAEVALEKFRVNTVTLPKDALPVAPGLQQTSPSAYTDFVAQRQVADQLRHDRRAISSAVAAAARGDVVVDQFRAIPTVQHSEDMLGVLADLQRTETALRDSLKVRTDSAPGVKRLKQQINDIRLHTIPQYAAVLLSNLDTEIASADSAINNSKSELQQIPVRSTEEDRLRREEDTEAHILDALTQRYTAARLIEASAIPDISIMDLAVAPLRATKNRRYVIVALGVIFGLGAGLGLVLLFDMTDNRVRYADQITSGLGLTILGVIPEIKRAKGETPTPEEAAQVIEAFRTVRLNLSHTVGSDRVVLTIASPAPSDGKSLIASNLALSFAEAGYKTLLVDGDTRRGELHRTFGLERRPGLLDYLSDELPQGSLIRMTSHPQLRLITAGSRKRNAPELLGSSKMRELVNRLRDQFEVIIIDSPPLGAGIDPFVLSTITGNMVLVVRAGATERDLAETKLQIVDQLPIRLVGAILNDVRATMHEYKYYSYSYGYGNVEEGEEPGKLPAVLDSK